MNTKLPTLVPAVIALSISLIAAGTLALNLARAAEPELPKSAILDCFISTGDNHWLGSRTATSYGGLQITPRSVFAPLANLKPGSTIHYRLVGVNSRGAAYGEDSQFQTASH